MSENEKLLRSSDDTRSEQSNDCEDNDSFQTQRRPKGFLSRNAVTLGLAASNILLLVTLVLTIFFWKPSQIERFVETYSPARESIDFMLKNEHATDHSVQSKYSGYPNDDNNKAWEDLIQPTFFGATEQEIMQAGDTVDDSVKLEDGGYVAALGVYHEVHCLRQLRLFLYSEHYYPNLTHDNILYLQGHLDHCLEALRMSVMCNADLSLYTFRWKAANDDRPYPKSNASRKCVNWDGVESWAMQRKVSLTPMLLRTTGEADRIHL
ncbi:hypothetical protein BCR34DRAFT_597362 [Clohesyomyces aquaticus]|uniref:Tat pathway signal sequence n=1 Tax=Clohesyomyces aquaticus TaxID=1231657 RepID=A0A1Y2A3W5_9PLEO|nr:hypothetical protein BCR34DRAFT_597362 [Clohesyomyces aquaticus]